MDTTPQPHQFIRFLRSLAASLISIAGLGLIAALWMRPLNEQAVLDTVLGAFYLILGIGLLGRGRFSLFLAIIAPIAVAAGLWHSSQPLQQVDTLRIAIDLTVATLCAIVLWAVRHQPSS